MNSHFSNEEEYSRQIGSIFDEGSFKTLQSISILIYGLKGVGIEIAKNFLMQKIDSIVLYDLTPAELCDLGCNPFLQEKDIGKPIGEACLNSLQAFKSDVKLINYQGEISVEFLQNFDVVLISNLCDLKEISRINEICRENKKKRTGFVYGDSRGLFNYVFVDFGPNFEVKDPNGKKPTKGFVKNIIPKGDNDCLIDYIPEDNDKLFQNNQKVIFDGLEEIPEINQKIFNVKNCNSSLRSFEIEEFKIQKDCIDNGRIKEIIQSIKINFKSLKERLENPIAEQQEYIESLDTSNPINPEDLIIVLLTLFEFYEKHSRVPKKLNGIDSENFLEIFERIYASNKYKTFKKINDKDLIRKISLYFETEIVPLSSCVGSIMTQEAMKIIGKYTPLNQWMLFDLYSMVSMQKNFQNCFLDSRYSHQLCLFGEKFQNNLGKMK